jgi:hypothetical protein
MIAIKEAVSRSYDAVSRSYDALKDMELVPETADVELEEAELEGNSWVVTLSYPEPIKPTEIEDAGPNLRAMLGKRRAY